MFKKFAVVALAAPVLAHAELPAGITTAITGAQTDGTTLVGALAGAGAVIFILWRVLARFGVTL